MCTVNSLKVFDQPVYFYMLQLKKKEKKVYSQQSFFIHS